MGFNSGFKGLIKQSMATYGLQTRCDSMYY